MNSRRDQKTKYIHSLQIKSQKILVHEIRIA